MFEERKKWPRCDEQNSPGDIYLGLRLRWDTVRLFGCTTWTFEKIVSLLNVWVVCRLAMCFSWLGDWGLCTPLCVCVGGRRGGAGYTYPQLLTTFNQSPIKMATFILSVPEVEYVCRCCPRWNLLTDKQREVSGLSYLRSKLRSPCLKSRSEFCKGPLGNK